MTINDWELASRLSCFFWSTLPDEPLLALAKAGRLHEPEVLRGEICRMLADPRAARFATTFPYQWLQLADVGKFAPNKKLYPNYNKTLEKSMIAETTSFFQQMLEKNLGIREFLQSDWTMMNGSLASFYGVSGVVDAPMKQVSLPAGSPRGGILTHAAVLILTLLVALMVGCGHLAAATFFQPDAKALPDLFVWVAICVYGLPLAARAGR